MPRKITPLNVKDAEVYSLARELSRRTGESLTEVVRTALREHLAREERRVQDPVLMEKLREICDRYAALPVVDNRTDDEIIGYDEIGVPR